MSNSVVHGREITPAEAMKKRSQYESFIGKNGLKDQTKSIAFTYWNLLQWLVSKGRFSDEIVIFFGLTDDDPNSPDDSNKFIVVLTPFKDGHPAVDDALVTVNSYNVGNRQPIGPS